jgi:hypothetical protein
MIALRKVMPVAAVLIGATPARRKATAAVRMSPPAISTGFDSLGGTLSTSILGSATGQPDLSQMRHRRQPRVVRSSRAMPTAYTTRSRLTTGICSPHQLGKRRSAGCTRIVKKSKPSQNRGLSGGRVASGAVLRYPQTLISLRFRVLQNLRTSEVG